MSSGKNMFVSLRNSTANKSATPSLVAPPTPAAFPPKQNNYAPPPVRRVTSTSSRNETKSTSPVPPPAPPRRKEVEPEGEWAEALYDYVSEVCESHVVDSSDYITYTLRILMIFPWKRTKESWLLIGFLPTIGE